MYENIKLTPGDKISFRLVESGVINASFKEVTFEGTVGYASALAVSPDINNKHQNLVPFFKPNYPDINGPADYNYFLIIHANGKLEAIGVPWIVKNSLSVVNNSAVNISVTNWSTYMESPVKDLLTRLGANFTIHEKD